MFLILWCLNINIKKLLLTVFSFQITLFNGTFVNILKIISSTYQITYHHSFLKTHIYQKHNYVFLLLKRCYQKYSTKYIFLHYEYFKYMLSHHFEQQYSNTSTKQAQIIYTCYCLCTNPLAKDVIEELMHSIIQNQIH